MGPSRRYRGLKPPLTPLRPPPLQPRRNMSNSLFDERFGVQQAGGVGGLGGEGGGLKHTMSDCVTWPQMQRGLLSSTTEAEMMAGGQHAPTFHDANAR